MDPYNDTVMRRLVKRRIALAKTFDRHADALECLRSKFTYGAATAGRIKILEKMCKHQNELSEVHQCLVDVDTHIDERMRDLGATQEIE